VCRPRRRKLAAQSASAASHAPSDSTQFIQQIHITAGHIIRGLVEEWLFPRADAAR
jgi:D-sedoheptulose 7-phosphate isomerase